MELEITDLKKVTKGEINAVKRWLTKGWNMDCPFVYKRSKCQGHSDCLKFFNKLPYCPCVQWDFEDVKLAAQIIIDVWEEYYGRKV